MKKALSVTGLLFCAAALQAAPLYSESFDSAATAKVRVNKQSDSAITYVDYSNFSRLSPPASIATNGIKIPEAPNRLSGSLPTRGVLLNSLYTTALRSVNLLAADAPGGTAINFSGNYHVSFDMWLSVDLTTVTGTTEAGLWSVGTNGNVVVARSTRDTGVGTWGWLTSEGGNGATATSGDAVLWVNNVAPPLPSPFRLENFTNASLYTAAFAQGRALVTAAGPLAKNLPAHQWTAVDIEVIDNRVLVKFNGVLFFDQPDGDGEGVALLGYEDINNTSTSGGPNMQFGLFDNFVVESIPDLPALAVAPATTFTPATSPGETPSADFTVSNNPDAATDFSILGYTIDGADASQFTLSTGLPLLVPTGGTDTLSVIFDPAGANGLKVARLLLTTDDPNAPAISVPLQARREIFTVEGSLTAIVPTVTTVGGTSAGQITITNQNTVAVDLTGLTVTGANAGEFSVTPTLPLTIAPSDSIVLAANFAPAGAAGVRNVSFDFTTSDPLSPLFSLPVRARYAAGPPLLAHYKLDDTTGTSLVDSSGNAFTAGRQTNDPTQPFFSQPSLLPGGAGTSCFFMPEQPLADPPITSGNYAIGTATHTPTVSYSLWIKPGAEAGERTILHRSSGFSLKGTLHSLFLTQSGKLVFEVNSIPVVETEDGYIADDQTYHVVVTHLDEDGFGSDNNNTTATRTRLYVDGVQVSERTVAVPGHTDYQVVAPGVGLYIGSATSAGEGFRGLLDDLQVYSIEATPEEAAGLFANPGKVISEIPPPVALDFKITSYTFDSVTRTSALTWNSLPGKTYTVSVSSTLATGDWTPIAPGLASGGLTTSYSEEGIPAGTDIRYYRVTQDN